MDDSPKNDEPAEPLHNKDADHRSRMRHDWHDLMEDIFEDGRQRGLFDDLPGKGRPLDLQQNVFEGSGSLANQLMRDNDLRPAWLGIRSDVEAKIVALRADVRRTWQRYDLAWQQAAHQSHRASLALGWDSACQAWETQIAEINKAVDNYNIRRPAQQLELFKLRLADELTRAEAPRYLSEN